MQVPVKNKQGEVVGHIEVQDSIFGVPFNMAVVHQALVRQLANARAGTADTKTRGEVAGSTRKLYPQKHTGWARAGDRRSPIRRGGGVAFGPHPRSYRQRMPKKMRRLALKCVLSAKLRDGELVVVDDIMPPVPKTKEMLRILRNLEGEGSSLIVTPEPQPPVVLSARNIPGVKTLPAPLLNVRDLLSHKKLIMTVDAVRRVEQVWGAK